MNNNELRVQALNRQEEARWMLSTAAGEKVQLRKKNADLFQWSEMHSDHYFNAAIFEYRF